MAKHNYSQYSNKKHDNKVDVAPDVTAEIQNGVITDAVTEGVGDTTTNVADTDFVVATVENKSVTDTDVTVTTLENKSTTETNSGSVATGVVANCAKLNIRSKPSTNGDVVTVLNVDDKVKIDVDKSTDEWFKIRTMDGVKGYCMRKFVSANI